MLKRILIATLALICVFAVLSLTLSVITDASHDCSEDNCPLCLCLSAREAVAALTMAIAFASLFVCAFAKLKRLSEDGYVAFFGILVYLKVKLSN